MAAPQVLDSINITSSSSRSNNSTAVVAVAVKTSSSRQMGMVMVALCGTFTHCSDVPDTVVSLGIVFHFNCSIA